MITLEELESILPASAPFNSVSLSSVVSPKRAAPCVPEFRLIVLPDPLFMVILPSALISRSPVM